MPEPEVTGEATEQPEVTQETPAQPTPEPKPEPTEQPEAVPQPEDDNTWDKMYAELFPGAPQKEPERPTREDAPKPAQPAEDSKIAALEKQIAEMAAMMREQARKDKLKEACEKYEERIPDWNDIKDDVLKLAEKYGAALSDGDYITLARAKRAGLDKPKPPTPKQADPAKAASARRAVSEKPSGAGHNADREYTSVEDAAAESLREIKAQLSSEK